jgi:hypothetical protein
MRRVVKRVLAAPFQPLITLPIVLRAAFGDGVVVIAESLDGLVPDS